MNTSTLRIVLKALKQASGFQSVIELRTAIFEQQSTNMNVQTIAEAIAELKSFGHDIREQTERRGKFRLPVKVFRLVNSENQK